MNIVHMSLITETSTSEIPNGTLQGYLGVVVEHKRTKAQNCLGNVPEISEDFDFGLRCSHPLRSGQAVDTLIIS